MRIYIISPLFELQHVFTVEMTMIVASKVSPSPWKDTRWEYGETSLIGASFWNRPLRKIRGKHLWWLCYRWNNTLQASSFIKIGIRHRKCYKFVIVCNLQICNNSWCKTSISEKKCTSKFYNLAKFLAGFFFLNSCLLKFEVTVNKRYISSSF